MSVHGEKWGWRQRHDEHFRRCEYCGSIHPEDLAAEPIWRPSWADQKYNWPHKLYVDIPNRDPDRIYCIGAAHGRGRSPEEPGFVMFADLTPRERLIVGDSGMRLDEYTSYRFGTKPMHHAKFYTLHLADPGLDPAAKAAIERVCGVQFDFDGEAGRVRWRVRKWLS